MLLFPRPASMTAQLSVAIAYGSNSETEDTAGMAHFLEHMIAGGSTHRIGLSQSVEQMGGYADFSTANEDTMIITDVMPDKLGKTSKTLIELLFDSSFEEEKFHSEQKIILHEIAETEDDPWTMMDELLRKCLFKTHPVKRPVLGLRKTVSQLNLTTLEEAHRAHYTPQNIVLVLTGNFSEKDVEKISQDFGNVKNTQATFNQALNNENNKRGKDIVKKKEGITQTYLSMGTKTIHAKHTDTPALDVIDTIMGAGASSRLFIELREKRALAYSIESGHEYGSDYGYFHIGCAIETKRIEETKKLIHQEIGKLRNEKVSENELNKAKDMITGSILRTIDSPVDFPETLANMEMLYSNENALRDFVNKVKALSANDISEVANKYLSENNWSSAVILPK